MKPSNPSRWELTGEFRPPRTGERYLSNKSGKAVEASSKSDVYTEPRYIVRERESLPALVAEDYEQIDFRAPNLGEPYLHQGIVLETHQGSKSWINKVAKPILRKKISVLKDASFEELSAELMRRFEAGAEEEFASMPDDILGGDRLAVLLVEDAQRLTEEDAREAALAVLTQAVLNEAIAIEYRMEACETILKYGNVL